ncbi:peptide deformylase [Streptococcus orisasini]|uniref:peptide deformylase n=1 Tax=Streptococcus orisasini TaxID=1080071 RepID=UPI0007095EBA|nr:peptide deformylase [Streptococcus orisasini]
MIRPIVKDIFFLQQKAEPATKSDLSVGQDLQDTLLANRDNCLGMAANMIGVNKRIIIVSVGFSTLVMYNPVITAKAQPYQTEESCLSLSGSRPAKRYCHITVDFFDSRWQRQSLSFKELPAQIIQHEMDHLEGRLI